MPKRQHDPDDDLDERGLLRDGRRIRVPMMMRDSADGLTDLQRSVRDHFAPARVVDAFGDSGLALHRPGSRYLVAGAGTVDHAKQVRPITCAEKRAINISPTFRMLGKVTTRTTARSRACTTPVILFATPIWTKSTISRQRGRASGRRAHDEQTHD